ncbi:hypothetical protein MKK58_17610 [Methylobacterium sp. J-078]|uniref:hypothetical protein n=1 Tax=Methylobacterium sp. J-078 TaxID=2836657 RepID=UPI001FB8C8A3|nr:hypothetical protein [Methylobacterium sp. J-078]MCJ2046335.1 hypothetical protein [Methylobacterium sp. J-078]
MPVKSSLPVKVRKAFVTFRDDIRNIAEMERGNFEEMSERWHEGDRSAEVSDWLDALDELVSDLDDITLPDDV